MAVRGGVVHIGRQAGPWAGTLGVTVLRLLLRALVILLAALVVLAIVVAAVYVATPEVLPDPILIPAPPVPTTLPS